MPLFMIIETFHNADPAPVYARFRAQGRLAPASLRYVSSWVTEDLSKCYQVMEAADRAPLDEWIEQWKDLVDFEVIPVLESADVAARFA
jgi:hypothetical protein